MDRPPGDQTPQHVHVVCPICSADSENSVTYEIEWTELGFVIGRERFVRCSFCSGESMLVGFKGDLFSASRDEVSRFLVPPAGMSDRIIVTFALLLCWLPFLGFWLALKSWRRLRRTHGVPRCAAIASLWVSGFFSVSALMAIVVVPIILYFEFG